MLDIVLLRLDAPLQSFGAPAVDNFGVIQEYPALSMLTGLLGNALGWERTHWNELQALQERVRYAVRCDRRGAKLTDFQTVDLGRDHMLDTGWTTRHEPERRKGGDASEGTHIRYRDYWSDSVFTVAMTVTAGGAPTLDQLENALQEPARPLFIGRKCCLPSCPLFIGRERSESLLGALEKLPRIARRTRGDATEPLSAWWPAEDEAREGSRTIPVVDERDWANQIHGGRRLMRHGTIRPPEVSNER